MSICPCCLGAAQNARSRGWGAPPGLTPLALTVPPQEPSQRRARVWRGKVSSASSAALRFAERHAAAFARDGGTSDGCGVEGWIVHLDPDHQDLHGIGERDDAR